MKIIRVSPNWYILKDKGVTFFGYSLSHVIGKHGLWLIGQRNRV